ncbi:MAG TPA: peptide ABC transporter substrate-binding protein, partial [Verrucomicrobiales bacterium]|nr:peptide ABC transporter substrate-binding protein [Verrucomicrobiales bacterium]
DGRRYTFHLRRGITWSDGTPITAGDFVWSWLRVLEPKTAADYVGILFYLENAEAFHLGRIKDPSDVGVRAVDDATLEVRLNSP